jgi:hypothetical protein
MLWERHTSCGGKDDETSPVVLDKFSHFDEC